MHACIPNDIRSYIDKSIYTRCNIVIVPLYLKIWQPDQLGLVPMGVTRTDTKPPVNMEWRVATTMGGWFGRPIWAIPGFNTLDCEQNTVLHLKKNIAKKGPGASLTF